MSSEQVRVVVTGLGATTPVGGEVASTWSALLAGRSGVRSITEAWAEPLPVRIAAPVAVEPAQVLPRVEARRLDRCEQLALVAAREGWQQAALSAYDPDRLGVVVASGIGGILTTLSQYDIFKEHGWQKLAPLTIPMLMPNGAAAWIGLDIGARAGVHTTVSACASGAEAIGYAIQMIRSKRADVVVAGGTEACIHPLNIAAFAQMRALSRRNDEPERASRPFDKARDGFVLGEGAAIVVLESAEHAAARGATVFAEAAGVGYSADAHHIAQPEPDGSGAALAIRRAMADADLQPEEVVHVNAHATATPAGDIAEAVAIRKAVGTHPLVTSTKSMTGHLLGGAGALEAIATILALYERNVPPTVNVDDPDDAVEIDIVRGEPRPLPGGRIAALNNSFGFGGHNVALAFRTA